MLTNLEAMPARLPRYSKPGYGPDDPYEQNIYWTLDSDKADAFYADMTNETGIPKAKSGVGLYTLYDTCGGTGHSPGDGDTCWNTGYEFNAPFPNGYTAADVTDLKDIVSKGLTNAGSLPDQITSAIQASAAHVIPRYLPTTETAPI